MSNTCDLLNWVKNLKSIVVWLNVPLLCTIYKALKRGSIVFIATIIYYNLGNYWSIGCWAIHIFGEIVLVGYRPWDMGHSAHPLNSFSHYIGWMNSSVSVKMVCVNVPWTVENCHDLYLSAVALVTKWSTSQLGESQVLNRSIGNDISISDMTIYRPILDCISHVSAGPNPDT